MNKINNLINELEDNECITIIISSSMYELVMHLNNNEISIVNNQAEIMANDNIICINNLDEFYYNDIDDVYEWNNKDITISIYV